MKVITVIRDNMMSAKYEFYMADNNHKEILHQLGAEFVSLDRISSIVDEGGMLPIFGIVPWKHHVLLTSKCKSVEEAFYYMARIIDEGLSKRELEDVIDNGDFGKQGKAITNFTSQLPTYQSQLAASVLKDPYRLDFLMLERGYNERDLEKLWSAAVAGLTCTSVIKLSLLRKNKGG